MEGQLQLVHESGHADHDEDEQRDRRQRQHPQVRTLAVDQLPDPDELRRERGRAEQHEARSRKPDLLVPSAFRQPPHRSVERGRAPQQVERRPSRLEVAGLVVHLAGDRDVAVAEVGHEQRHGGGGHQVERTVPAAGADRQSDDDGQQDEVHERVRHADQPVDDPRGRVGGDRAHQVDPRDRPDADRDDQGVDETLAVPAGTAAADDQQDAEDEARVDGEVQHVADRGVRELGVEEALVVVGDHVARDEQGLP